MPRIQWSGLPPALRDHLFDRLRERKITAEDLYELKAWRESNPGCPAIAAFLVKFYTRPAALDASP